MFNYAFALHYLEDGNLVAPSVYNLYSHLYDLLCNKNYISNIY